MPKITPEITPSKKMLNEMPRKAVPSEMAGNAGVRRVMAKAQAARETMLNRRKVWIQVTPGLLKHRW